MRLISQNIHLTKNRPVTHFRQWKYKDALHKKQILKKGIWIYFLLLIFEGALRKWGIPGLSTPLLIVRDPLALLIIFGAMRQNIYRSNIFSFLMIFASIVGAFAALFVGHGNLAVTIFGARILLLHFPLIFIIGHVFDRQDVLTLGKFCLWIAGPMTLLIALQFYSSQSAWVNRGVGGEIGGGFDGAMGYLRPSSTFSFTNGTSLFYGFCAPFIFYFWLHAKERSLPMLIIATISLIAAIPLSISRGLLFTVGICSIFAILATFRKPQYLGRLVLATVGVSLALLLLGKASFFETATGAFLSRFEKANEVEGGVKGVLGDRYFGGMISALTESTEIPFWGYGMGMGTNVGSMLLTGKNDFLIAEGEWGRLIGEMGVLLGVIVILIRLGLSFRIAMAARKKLAAGDLLPWLLLSFALLQIPQGQWAQPTALGFSVVIGGLVIASLKSPQLRS